MEKQFSKFHKLPKGIVLTFFLFILFWFQLRAQQDNQIDSLVNAINRMVDDSGKVISLIQLGQLCVDQSRVDEGSDYLNKAMVLGKDLKFNEGVIRAYMGLGIVNRQQGKQNEALNFLELALDIAKKANNSYAILRVNTELGETYRNMGNQDEALNHYMVAVNVAQELNDQEEMSFIYNNIGIMYDFQGKYTEAMEYYLKSLKIARDSDNKFGIARGNVNIAWIYYYEGDFDQALQHHQAALKIWKELKDKPMQADSYGNIGEIYFNQGKRDDAIANTLLSLQLAKETDYKKGQGAAYNILGIIYSQEGKHQEALANYFDALEIWQKIGDAEKLATTYVNIGKSYCKLGQYSEASQYLNKALLLARSTGNKLNVSDALYWLSEVEEANNNYVKALSYFKLYKLYTDSLTNENASSQLAELKKKYETEKKDQEIELLNKDKSLQQLELNKEKHTKKYFIAGLILFVLLSFFVYKNYQTRQELKVLNLRNKIASDLHDDIGSTLSSISIFSQMAQVQSGVNNTAMETIGESSRKMLDAMADIVWAINPENDQFEKMILRMRGFAFELLGAKQMEFEFDVDGEVTNYKLPMEARKNLFLIFKEATNNMVKYSEADKAMFAITGEKNKLSMMIRDNGKGFNASNEQSGNGLKNMKKRALEMDAQLWIDSMPGAGTTIKLEMAV